MGKSVWETAPGVVRVSPSEDEKLVAEQTWAQAPDSPDPHPMGALAFLISGNCARQIFLWIHLHFQKPLNSNVLNYHELRTQLAPLKVTLKSLQAKEFGVPPECCVPNNNTPGHLSLLRMLSLTSSLLMLSEHHKSSQAGQVLPAPVCR